MALKGQQQLIKGPNKRLRKRKLLYIVHTSTTRMYCRDILDVVQNRVSTEKSQTKSWIFKLNLTSLSVSQEKEQQSTDMQKRNNKKSSAEKANSAFGLYHLLLQL